jgi:Lon protease-like protein
MTDRFPERLPLFPLSTVLFPGTSLPIHVFEERYRRLLADQADADPAFGVVLITAGREVGDQPETAAVGAAASIVGRRDLPDGRCDLVVKGGRRFKVLDRDWSGPYLVARVAWLPEIEAGAAPSELAEEIWRGYVALANAYLRQARQAGMPAARLEAPAPPEGLQAAALGYLLASRLPIAASERQRLLAADSASELLRSLAQVMTRERRLVSSIGATLVLADRRPEAASDG